MKKTHEDLELYKGGGVKNQSYFISAVSAGCEVDINILKTIKNFCKKNNAKPIILGMRKHNRPLKNQPQYYDTKIEKLLGKCLCRNMILNKNLYMLDAQINPQQINPLTGLNRYKKNGKQKSLIVGSPKVMLETKPVGNGKYPRLVLTTGALNKPEYQYNRIGLLAKQMHKIAGVVVKIIDDTFFVLRHVEFDSTNSFIDLGIKYSPNKISKAKVNGLVLGDLHAEKINKNHLKICIEQLQQFNPEFTVLHDVISYSSVSHHNSHDLLQQQYTLKELPSLKHEINLTKSVLQTLDKHSNQLCVVDSNHHDHLAKWISDGRFVKDVVNFEIGCKLATHAMRGRNISQAVLDPADKYIWWQPNDDYYIKGVHVSNHGHRGGNGRFGNPRELSDILNSCVCGHRHSPAIYEEYTCVGINCDFDMGYNKGPSSWLQANCLIYENGTKQLLISVPETDIWK